MAAYLIRRLLLIIPTLWAIITINFFIVQIAPGGPVDQAIADYRIWPEQRLPGGAAVQVQSLGHARIGAAIAVTASIVARAD